MDQNDHNIMESTSTSTKEQKDCEAFMTYGNDHIRNLSKQYQGDGVGACGSLEKCLKEWGASDNICMTIIKSGSTEMS